MAVFLSTGATRTHEAGSRIISGPLASSSSSDSHERVTACRRLGWFGKESNKAVRYIEPLLRDPNQGVQAAAAYALNQIDTALERIDPHAKERPELYR